MSSTGFRAKSAARLAAVQALFQFDQRENAEVSSLVLEFLNLRVGKEMGDDELLMADTTFFSNLVQYTVAHLADIDAMIESHLSDDWTIGRIDPVLKAILRVGICELQHVESTPVAVAINEYLDVTMAFFDKKEVSFVNTVLDQVAKKIRPQEEDSQ